MKRYKAGVDYSDNIIKGKLIEDPDGEWVKWEDIKGILEYKDQLKGYKLKGQSVECNCLHHFTAADPFGGYASKNPTKWICPAHGYKRL